MSVHMQQFRVVGVNSVTGKDVSVVIDAATKAAAEVKAEKMHIETTHIVRLKQEVPTPPDEHELFSSEAAEALASQRTINLIEECVTPEEPRQSPVPPPAAPQTTANIDANPIVAVITRPNYNAPSSQRDSSSSEVSGLRAFALVLVVLLGISAGAYFVLVHEPNTLEAQQDELVFGHDLFSDVINPANTSDTDTAMRDAFNTPSSNPDASTAGPPIAKDQQVAITNAPVKPLELTLQSVATTNEGRFAIINGKLYKQGANIGSAKLVSIADDWVLIERNGKQFTLEIEASTNSK